MAQWHGSINEVGEGNEEPGLFLVGGSAYSIWCYLLIPHPYEDPCYSKDPFNFLFIKYRIQLECNFGELIIRCF